MNVQKTSATITGTLFYSKINDTKGSFRVRFRSFQQGMLQNRERKEELAQIQTNYNYFKYGKSSNRRGNSHAGQRQSQPKLYKNLKDRERDSEELRTRLKSMREARRNIFEKLKTLKE